MRLRPSALEALLQASSGSLAIFSPISGSVDELGAGRRPKLKHARTQWEADALVRKTVV